MYNEATLNHHIETLCSIGAAPKGNNVYKCYLIYLFNAQVILESSSMEPQKTKRPFIIQDVPHYLILLDTEAIFLNQPHIFCLFEGRKIPIKR